MLNASGGKVMGQLEKLVETKANTTLVSVALETAHLFVLLHLIA